MNELGEQTRETLTPIRALPPLESPSQERRRIENKKLDEEWKICGSGTSRHLIKYLVQMGFALMVMIFSIVKLNDNDNSENKEIYYSLMSFIIGIIFPHPQIKGE